MKKLFDEGKKVRAIKTRLIEIDMLTGESKHWNLGKRTWDEIYDLIVSHTKYIKNYESRRMTVYGQRIIFIFVKPKC